jgi:hypothetical protein
MHSRGRGLQALSVEVFPALSLIPSLHSKYDFVDSFGKNKKKSTLLFCKSMPSPLLLHPAVQSTFHKFLKRRQACNLYDLLFHAPDPAGLSVIPVLWHAMDERRHMSYRIASIAWDSVYLSVKKVLIFACG